MLILFTLRCRYLPVQSCEHCGLDFVPRQLSHAVCKKCHPGESR